MVKINDNQSIMFNPKRKIENISLSKIELLKEKIEILIKKLNNLDKKYVWIPNIKIPTSPLKRPRYFAPFTPREDLKITEKGRPYFWEGFPMRVAKKYRRIEATNVPIKTTKTFSS